MVLVSSCSFGQTPIWPLFCSSVRMSNIRIKIENRISRFSSGKSGRDSKSRTRVNRVRPIRGEAV